MNQLFPADEDFRESLRGIVADLFSLEVNTILKANMTGQKMPALPSALFQIAQQYHEALGALEHKKNRAGNYQLAAASSASFGEIQGRAEQLLPLLEQTDAEASDYFLLCRIAENCREITRIIDKQAPGFNYNPKLEGADQVTLNLTHRQQVAIRKIWEIGTEVILLQTAVQLDGDVVTRVNPSCLAADRMWLLKIHHDATSTATGFWRSLVELIANLFHLSGNGK